MKLPLPLVNVIVPTYNQQQYIEGAIESVLSQVCSFPFNILIGDDRSEDATYEICFRYSQLYPDKITVFRPNANAGLVKNYRALFKVCKAKYIAILEGDDYWTDPLKLQSQVDILEANPEIGLVHTRSCSLFENGTLKLNTHLHQSDKEGHGLYEEILMGSYPIVPLTVCFRRELFEKFVDFEFCLQNKLTTIDAFLWPEMARHTKFHFLDKVTGHYRVLSNSLSNSSDFERFQVWYEKGMKILNYYQIKYPLSPQAEKKMFSNMARLAVKVGLENRQYDFTVEMSKSLMADDLKSVLLRLIGKNRMLHRYYPIYTTLFGMLSRIKQLLH
ncbi:glycosyltransferase [uncultured Imperialibacter sp.]|uniref:glycosyltransferase n=1 Tax=uncultured Imperialibacter sp. TaxID=1672639 RepID=UPI0030D7A870|tara:strand:+ start:17376 stop:18365 length:990 start_codon:yes stop_codon:yes gene_type:complete